MSRVKRISKFADLDNPEEIKELIATRYKSNKYKMNLVWSYDAYLRFMGKDWIKPNFNIEDRLPFIPAEKELQAAMNTGHKENYVFIKTLYETGARKNEVEKMEWTDLDPERPNIFIKASKKCNSRYIRISQELMDLLLSLPKQKDCSYIFNKKAHNSRSSAFHNRMRRMARICNNPRLKEIHLHTL